MLITMGVSNWWRIFLENPAPLLSSQAIGKGNLYDMPRLTGGVNLTLESLDCWLIAKGLAQIPGYQVSDIIHWR